MILAAQQVIIGLLVLGVLVLIHEFGHFAMAKWCGIRVLSFSIGFGTPLLRKTIGGTEYRIGAIPFGGYVHMAGEHPEDAKEQAPDEYTAKPIWQRALVACAGPAANYLSALLILWVVFLAGVQRDVYLDRPIIGAVVDSSAAWEAGITAGDSIVALNGEPVASWDDIEQQFSTPEPSYEVTVVSRGEKRTVPLSLATARELGVPKSPSGGMLPPLPPRVGAVQKDSPAGRGGVETGDTVTAINDTAIHSWYQLSQIVSAYDSSMGALRVTVARGDSSRTLEIVPAYNDEAERFLLGITVAQPASRTVRFGPFAAVSRAMGRAWRYTTMIFDILAKLVTKQVSARQLAGPIGIVQMSGAAALAGLTAVLNFMALIGINLAVINLFPLVITDGGVLLFLIIESIRGKPLSVKAQSLINRIAIAFFIALFLFISFNDIQRIPILFRMLGR
ncbi:MAG: RIP metalloprotease RseP [Chitinivibrionales bacterium]|nr:RIP metalloprotease RseP [Chitinivibrionales bacterium]MBD3394528.1 RIP metalloprotease RseP [Chitinivibrionales bacterium]